MMSRRKNRLTTQGSALFTLWQRRISYASMLRSARQGDESVRVAGGRSSPQIVRFIRVPILADCFQFGSVKDVDTRRCRSVPYRRARLSIRVRTTCVSGWVLFDQVDARTRPLTQAVPTGPADRA